MINLHLLHFFCVRSSTEVRNFWEQFVSISASSIFFLSLSNEGWKPFAHKCTNDILENHFADQSSSYSPKKSQHFPLRTWGSLSTAIYSVELDCRSPICSYSLSTFTSFETISEKLIRPVESWVYLNNLAKTLELCIDDHVRPSKTLSRILHAAPQNYLD